MEPYDYVKLQERYANALRVMNARLEECRAYVSLEDTVRTEKLDRRIRRLIKNMDPRPEKKLTKKELRKAKREANVIAEMLAVLHDWVIKATSKAPVTCI